MNSVPITKAVWRLAVAWMVGGFAIFVVLMIQWLSGVYSSTEVPQVLTWYTKQVLPTLTLIVTAAIKQLTTGGSDATVSIDARVFYLSVIVSVFYLLLALVAPLTWRFVEQNPLIVLDTWTLYLALLQSIVSAVLGVFFLPTPKPASATVPGKN